ncbi:MAG: ferrous iron transporter B, partial [Clostridia bacterium]|nr:ferrous iron transporter B [Clostridia bacterium]
GWSITTAICVIIFMVMHWPCSTTLLTVKKETGSVKWTALAFVLPTIMGLLICAAVTFMSKILF